MTPSANFLPTKKDSHEAEVVKHTLPSAASSKVPWQGHLAVCRWRVAQHKGSIYAEVFRKIESVAPNLTALTITSAAQRRSGQAWWYLAGAEISGAQPPVPQMAASSQPGRRGHRAPAHEGGCCGGSLHFPGRACGVTVMFGTPSIPSPKPSRRVSG